MINIVVISGLLIIIAILLLKQFIAPSTPNIPQPSYDQMPTSPYGQPPSPYGQPPSPYGQPPSAPLPPTPPPPVVNPLREYDRRT